MDVGDVARDVRLDGRVDQGRHRALVLAVLPEHLRADRDDRRGVLAAEDLAHRQLVAVVGVGVQEADADRRYPPVAEPPSHFDGPGLVEGPDLVALEIEATTDRLDEVCGHDARRLDPEVRVAVAIRHRLPGDLEDELIALGRDEAEPLDLALEQLVRRDGGAVRDRGDILTGRAHEVEDLADAVDETVGGVARRRWRLGGDELTRLLVQGDDVGERPTRVDADPDPSCSQSCSHGKDSTVGRRPMPWHKLPMEGDDRARHRQSTDSPAEDDAGWSSVTDDRQVSTAT